MAEAQPIEIKAPIEGGNAIAPPDAKDLADLQHAEQPYGQQLSDAANENLIRATQLTYALREAKAQKQQKAIDDALSKVDFDTKDILPQDSNEIYGDVKTLMNNITKNPSILLPDPKNPTSMQDYANFKNQVNQIYQKIDTSKWWNARDKMNQDHVFNSVNDPYNTDENKSAWDKTINTAGVLNRKLPQFSQKDPLNTRISEEEFGKDLPKQKYSIEYPTGVGNETRTISIDAVTPTQIKQRVQTFKGTPQGKANLNAYTDQLLAAMQHQDNKTLNYDLVVPDLSKDRNKKGQLTYYTKPLAQASFDEFLLGHYGRAADLSDYAQGLQGARESLASGNQKEPDIVFNEQGNLTFPMRGSDDDEVTTVSFPYTRGLTLPSDKYKSVTVNTSDIKKFNHDADPEVYKSGRQNATMVGLYELPVNKEGHLNADKNNNPISDGGKKWFAVVHVNEGTGAEKEVKEYHVPFTPDLQQQSKWVVDDNQNVVNPDITTRRNIKAGVSPSQSKQNQAIDISKGIPSVNDLKLNGQYIIDGKTYIWDGKNFK